LVTYFREDEKRVRVCEGSNKVGRFLEVAIAAKGGRKGIIWLPKGRKGWGWRRFVGEMRQMLEYQGGKIKPFVSNADHYPSQNFKKDMMAVFKEFHEWKI
jgi:hypothetical protein